MSCCRVVFVVVVVAKVSRYETYASFFAYLHLSLMLAALLSRSSRTVILCASRSRQPSSLHPVFCILLHDYGGVPAVPVVKFYAQKGSCWPFSISLEAVLPFAFCPVRCHSVLPQASHMGYRFFNAVDFLSRCITTLGANSLYRCQLS